MALSIAGTPSEAALVKSGPPAPCPSIYDLEFSLDVQPVQPSVAAGAKQRFDARVAYHDEGTCPPPQAEIQLCAKLGPRARSALRAPDCRRFDVLHGANHRTTLDLKARKGARGRYRVRFVAAHVTTFETTQGDLTSAHRVDRQDVQIRVRP